MKRIAQLALVFALAIAPAFAQIPEFQNLHWKSATTVIGVPGAVSGQTQSISTNRSQYINRIGFSTTGSPTSVTFAVQCWTGNTQSEWCGEWDSSQSAAIIILGFYTKFDVTATFSGGSSPTADAQIISYDGDGWGPSLTFTPAQLGVNAASVLTTANSAFSPIINLRGVRSVALIGTCDQTWKFVGKFYAENGSTLIYNADLTTAMTAATTGKLSITEQSASVDFGGGAIAASTAFRLPIAGMQFAINNTSVSTATCSIRLQLQY